MKNKPDYIVIDTNVLISAGLLPTSKTALVLALAVEHFVIAQNQLTWHELETRIARPKFDTYFGDSGRLRHLVKIAQSIQYFVVKADVSVSRDMTDDKFIALAIDSGAKLLISGDPDLKDIRTHKGIDILSPAQFLERYKPSSSLETSD
jgi:putative PIN family toxin of toxin-antitoxin system